MLLQRRHLLLAGLASASLSAIPLQAAGNRTPIRLIVPFPPGGGGDVLARSVGDEFGRRLGEKLWIDNRPGAGGTIGARLAAKQPQDGRTRLYATNGILCVNPLLYKNIPFDPLASLEPVGQISSIGLIGVLNPNAVPGVTDLQSLLSFAQKHPGSLDFASSGNGTTSHLAGCFLSERTGLSFSHVPYKGGSAAILDVLAGRIPFMIDVAPNVLPHIRSGKLKALGVTAQRRLRVAPEIPTFAEAGISGFELAAWDGIMAPKGTSEEVLESLSCALAETLQAPETTRRLAVKGAEAASGRRADFSAFIAEERPKWARLVERVRAEAD